MMCGAWRGGLWVYVGLLLAAPTPLVAQDDPLPAGVLELSYVPTARAQIAIWIETEDGRFLDTLKLTEAVAYRGIGNRPGASQMNSGYRWPYGRREGVLPIWAARRAAAPGARPFKRVIFQDRDEGAASQTTPDQSVDDYFCLSFDRTTTERDALDAVSCASVFTSDKGRFMTESDVEEGYSEPYEDPVSGVSMMAPLPLASRYPPRMDVTRCTVDTCYDHEDVDAFVEHARAVMPEIDAVTMATPQGDTPQSELITIPAHWPEGRYVVWLEINVEGDYNETFDPEHYPMPTRPSGEWDYWATSFGYPYRGQPSVAYSVPIELAGTGEATFATDRAEGRASWDVWDERFGRLEGMSGMTDDPGAAPGSGADRLRAGEDGQRLTVKVEVFGELGTAPDPDPPDKGDPRDPDGDPSGEPEPDEDDDDQGDGDDDPDPDAPRIEIEDVASGGATIITELDVAGVGAVRGLELYRYPSLTRGHEWIRMRFRAPESELGLHRYEVRVATDPIVDEESFLKLGRPAKRASADDEGATSLKLPVDQRPGDTVKADIGDLVASTRYHVAVRAVDRLNRKGPISVAEIETPERQFTTVTPCFVASVAYGTPLAAEVGMLRRARDRFLLSHAPGRALVRAYYRHGPGAARFLEAHPGLRARVRQVLDWAVGALRGM